MNTVRVTASKDYNIYIGSSLLDGCSETVASVAGICRAAVITDDTVNRLYADRVCSSLSRRGIDAVKFVFEHGEHSKTSETYVNILNFLAENKLTRSDCIIALGGGIPGDVAGFAAATYLRGVKFIQIPTTLLSAVDSSVGGKTAINLKSGKNLAGAFYQPDAVICDYSTLSTLEPGIFADGCAEVIKYGVILDEDFLIFLQDNDISQNIGRVITRCVELKRDIVAADERDTGIRAILNFGHTIGHAVEKCSDFAVSHGSAVAIGMVIAARGAYKTGMTDCDCAEEIERLLIKNNLPTKTSLGAQELFEAACSDKKRTGDSITLIVPEKIGKCVGRRVNVSEVLDFIKAGIQK